MKLGKKILSAVVAVMMLLSIAPAASAATYDADYCYSEGYDVAVQIGAEGSVLLKNKDNLLPLAEGTKVTVLGAMSYNYVEGGTGSAGGADDENTVLMLDALLEGNGEVFFNALQHLILPSLTLAFVHLGIVARQVRSAMLEQLSEDYIRTARASGLPGWYIVLRYALPNAMIPSITVLGLALGDLLYGAVLTETVFAWPGMGAWVVTSIQALDFPAVMGFAVVVSLAYVLVNLVVDLLYLWIDPRIGRGGAE